MVIVLYVTVVVLAAAATTTATNATTTTTTTTVLFQKRCLLRCVTCKQFFENVETRRGECVKTDAGASTLQGDSVVEWYEVTLGRCSRDNTT